MVVVRHVIREREAGASNPELRSSGLVICHVLDYVRICSAKHTTRAVEIDEDVRQSVYAWKNFAVLVVLLIKPVARVDLRIAIQPLPLKPTASVW